MIQRKKIKSIFRDFHSPQFLEIDPLLVVHRFKDSESLPEIALTAALLSYGRVSQIIKAIEYILERTDNLAHSFITELPPNEIRKKLSDFKYRFHIGDDITLLILVYREILNEYGSLTQYTSALWENSSSGEELFNHFTQDIKRRGTQYPHLHRNYFDWLLPSPLNGSPCKRIAMFFRWMVREDDGIDLGIWDFIPPSNLIIPVDTHVARVAKSMGLTHKASSSWSMALEITENLKKLCRTDPVKFDFSLCRAGMLK